MSEPAARPGATGKGPAFWGGLAAFSLGALIVLRLTGAIEGATVLLLAMVPMGLLVLFVRAMERRQAARGCISPAVLNYNRGMLAASFAYVLGLGIAILLHRNMTFGTAMTWLIAFLPIVPIFGMIRVMARYLREESDEYLRHRAIMASLAGLALVLGLGSFWGFLETFALVPHIPGWFTVPVWALGLGLAQLWMKVRDR